jgi:hypothetical protein
VKQTWFYNEFYIGINGEAAVNLLAWYPRELDAAVAVVQILNTAHRWLMFQLQLL